MKVVSNWYVASSSSSLRSSTRRLHTPAHVQITALTVGPRCCALGTRLGGIFILEHGVPWWVDGVLKLWHHQGDGSKLVVGV